LQTGDYPWRESLTPGLLSAIEKKVSIWVPSLSPFGYDCAKPEDVLLWRQRRKAGLEWVKSAQAESFAKSVYKMHASIFLSETKG